MPDDPRLEGLTIWDEYPGLPVEDWQHEVANGDTRQGYWYWVLSQLDSTTE